MCIHRSVSPVHIKVISFHPRAPSRHHAFRHISVELIEEQRGREERWAEKGQTIGKGADFFQSGVHAPYCHELPHSLESKPQLALRNPLWFFPLVSNLFQIMYSCRPGGGIIFLHHITALQKKKSSSLFCPFCKTCECLPCDLLKWMNWKKQTKKALVFL